MNNPTSKDQETRTMASIAKSSIASIESSITALTNLLENMKTYRQCFIDCVNLQMESADSEYKVTPPFQSHTLPGVISVPQPFNKSDTEKTEQLGAYKEKALKQKRIYLRLVEKDSRLFSQSLRGIQYSDIQFEEFLEILNGNINLDLQPIKIYDDPKKSKPNIKLILSNDFLKK
jgi:hypothetical protein